ncbi:MAG: ethylbenzene dehydrogenase-related protein, partial [Planctomycetota bacterium]
MKRTLWLACFAWLGCAAAPDAKGRDAREASDEPLVWLAAHTATAPTIDGQVDSVWQSAEPLTVVIREALGGGAPRTVVLRALHDGDSVYVLAQWPDATRSDMRDPYVWDPVKNVYARPSKPDDQFALEFPLTGDFRINMMTTESEFTADVWHWKAGRGNPVGWVDDKRHLIQGKPRGKARAYDMGGHETVYIARLMDSGKSSYSVKDAP